MQCMIRTTIISRTCICNVTLQMTGRITRKWVSYCVRYWCLSMNQADRIVIRYKIRANQINSVQNLTPYSIKIHINSTLMFMLMSPERSIPTCFDYRNCNSRIRLKPYEIKTIKPRNIKLAPLLTCVFPQFHQGNVVIVP